MVKPVSRHWEGQVLILNQVMYTKFCFQSCAEIELLWSPTCRKTRKILGRMITGCNDVIWTQAAYEMFHCRLLGNNNELNSIASGHKCSEISWLSKTYNYESWRRIIFKVSECTNLIHKTPDSYVIIWNAEFIITLRTSIWPKKRTFRWITDFEYRRIQKNNLTSNWV